MATGKVDDPLTLADALKSTRIKPGHTVWLRGGVYTGDFAAGISGAEGGPITLRPYQGERVQIDGTLFLQNAAYLDVLDCEIHWTGWTTRTSTTPYGVTPDIPFPAQDGVALGTGCRLINCTIYDTREGVDGFASGVTLYGCLIYNNGWYAQNRGTGHAFYSHNAPGVLDTVRHNVILRQFNRGLHLYSGSTNAIQNYAISENVLMGGQVIGNDRGPVRDIVFEGNVGYRADLGMGYYTTPGTERLTMRGNRWHGSATFKVWESAEVTENTFIHSMGDYAVRVKMPDAVKSAYVWDRNAYYAADGVPLRYNTPPDVAANLDSATLADWQTLTGWDRAGTRAKPPAPDAVYVWPNEWAAVSRRKGLIVVCNDSGAESVTVDLSAAKLTAGAKYVLRQAQDPLVDVTAITYDGKLLTLDMRAASHSVAVPFAHTATIDATTFPLFGAFVIEAA